MEIFGPVQSRRFGLSLGINHLPPKVCSYACVYCQLGATNALSDQLQPYSNPQEIFQAVAERLAELDTPPDYLTFVSNGEPCLDTELGRAIQELKRLGIPVAVIRTPRCCGARRFGRICYTQRPFH
jgi:wyosine [tRNA(Phe)-imidazoG37] synthetase (radical SAM superfamily)